MQSSPEQLAQQLQDAFAVETQIIEEVRVLCGQQSAVWLSDRDRRASRMHELSELMTRLQHAAATSSTLLELWKQVHVEVPARLRQANAMKVQALQSALREVRLCCAEAEGEKQRTLGTLAKSNQLQESLAAYAGK